MPTIRILGPGCARCRATEAVVRDVLTADGISADVQKVEDIQEMMAYDVMATPALVIDELVVLAGRVPTADEVRSLLASR